LRIGLNQEHVVYISWLLGLGRFPEVLAYGGPIAERNIVSLNDEHCAEVLRLVLRQDFRLRADSLCKDLGSLIAEVRRRHTHTEQASWSRGSLPANPENKWNAWNLDLNTPIIGKSAKVRDDP